MTSYWRTVALAAVAFALSGHITSAAKRSAVFCSANSGAKILAIAPAAHGQLRFGISVWTPEGSNITVFGTAAPAQRGWRYTNRSKDCSLDLLPAPKGGFIVRADPAADCAAYAGQGARIGTVYFTPSENEGPVTTQLDGPEAFQHAGKCAGGN